MKSFYVINSNITTKNFERYDIMPYLINQYKVIKKNRPISLEEFKKFIRDNSLCQWWSRCEYEIIISHWPDNGISEKWDIHKQVMMNIDIIAEVLMNNVKDLKK